MILIAIGWIYVVGMVAVAEALAPNGSVLGALFTFAGWGLLPLAVVLYIGNTPARKRRLRREQAEQAVSAGDPDRAGHAAGDAVTPEREEPR